MSILDEWAVWDGGNWTCFDIVEKSVNHSYNSGLQDGIIFGAIIGVIVTLTYRRIKTQFTRKVTK